MVLKMKNTENKYLNIELKKCIKICGGQKNLAYVLSVSRPQIDRWLNNVRQIPYKHAITLSHIFDIDIDKLNPSVKNNEEIAKKHLHECQKGTTLESQLIKRS